MKMLDDLHRELSNLAMQIAAHAERAPYPHVATRLREIAAEKRAAAGFLREQLPLSGRATGQGSFAAKAARNHWERMAQDLNDHRVLETRLIENAARLDEAAPETADLLRRIAASQRHQAKIFLDFIARADPQAHQT